VKPLLPILLLAAWVGCGNDGSEGSESTPGLGGSLGSATELSRQVGVVRNNADLPFGCRPLQIGKLALSFSDAINRGDEQALAEAWSGPFKWFSVTAARGVRSAAPLTRSEGRRRHFVAYSPDAALDYARAPRGFRMRLTEFVVNGPAIGRGVNVYYGGVWLEPLADGMRRYGLDGKGFISCGRRADGQSIRVWSMSVEGKPDSAYGTCRDGTIRPRDLVICWKP
jgi:hypothetical protein